MKKQVKYGIVTLLIITVIFTILVRVLEIPSTYTNTFPTHELSAELTALATELISVNVGEKRQYTTTTYEGLNAFADVALEKYPALSDEDLVLFIMEYTGQPYMEVSDSFLEQMLALDNITTTHFCGKRNLVGGDVTLTSEDASDSNIEVSVHYSKVNDMSPDASYIVWAYATLLDDSIISTNANLHLNNTAVFDSSYEESGSLHQVGYCEKCSKYTTKSYHVTSQKRQDGILTLEYDDKDPGLDFKLVKTRCSDCQKQLRDVNYTSFVQYRVMSDERFSLQFECIHDKVLADKYFMNIMVVD